MPFDVLTISILSWHNMKMAVKYILLPFTSIATYDLQVVDT
jgi:hypothetical protein